MRVRPRTLEVSVLLGLVLAASIARRLPAADASTPFTFDGNLGEWIQSYYQHPEPARAVAALSYYSDSDLYRSGSSRMSMAQFFATLLQRDPGLAEELFRTFDESGSEAGRWMALHVFWLARLPATDSLLERCEKSWSDPDLRQAAAKMRALPADAPLDSAVDHPADIDRIWAIFFATGSDAPVEKIASLLPMIDGHGQEILLGGAARWSLTSNCRQHPRVREIVERLAGTAPAESAARLREVLEPPAAR
jgi:hypothetical protein